MRANYKKTAIILGLSVILIGWGGTDFCKENKQQCIYKCTSTRK